MGGTQGDYGTALWVSEQHVLRVPDDVALHPDTPPELRYLHAVLKHDRIVPADYSDRFERPVESSTIRLGSRDERP